MEQIQASLRGTNVRLLAVSKGQSVERIQQFIAHYGHDHFGENYVQELAEKAVIVPDVKWHFIGQLQGNKIAALLKIPSLWAIETIDSERHAMAVQNECAKINRAINVFVQVNISHEPQKAGVDPGHANDLVSFVNRECPLLHLLGLMCIGTGGSIAEMTQMRSIRDKIDPQLELSMGMSDDWPLALQCGATEIRVGRAIFGPRIT